MTDTAKLKLVKTTANIINKTAVKPVDKDKVPDKKTPVKIPSKISRDSTDSHVNKGKKIPGNIKPPDTLAVKKDTAKIKRDSIYMSADTLETQILTYKNLKALLEKRRLASIKDTTIKAPSIVYKKPVKYIELAAPKMGARYYPPLPRLLWETKAEVCGPEKT